VIRRYFELAFWISALTLSAFMAPETDPHYSFCLFKMLGLKICPGCGIAHSVSYLFHGNIQASLSSHPMGIFAVVIILARIFTLIQLHFFSKKTQNYAKR